MTLINNVLQSIENAGFDDLGPVEEVARGHWIIGEGCIFPVQLERLAESENYLLYTTAIRQTGEPVTAPFIQTVFLENLSGHSLGRYGICAGPVTLTLYQQISINTPASAERLAALITCHRMLMDCYISSGFSQDDEFFQPVTKENEAMVLPFRH